MAKSGRGGRRQSLFNDGRGQRGGTMNRDFASRINNAKSVDGMLMDSHKD